MPPDPGGGYRLATLLDLKVREEEAQRVELAARVAATGEARQRLSAAEARRKAAKARCSQAIIEASAMAESGEALVGELAGARLWVGRLEGALVATVADVERAALAVEAAEQAEGLARATLAQAAAERQALEKHRAAWEAAERRAAERRAEAERDDLGKK